MSNLLPLNEKKQIRILYLLRLTIVSLLFLLIVLIAGNIFLVPSFILVTAKEKQLTSDIEEAQESLFFETKKDITVTLKETEENIQVLRNDESRLFSSALEGVLDEKGKSVSLDGFFLKKELISKEEVFKFSIQGEADSRDALISFVDRLKAHDGFLNVELPVSNLIKSEDISFSFSIDVSKTILVPQN